MPKLFIMNAIYGMLSAVSAKNTQNMHILGQEKARRLMPGNLLTDRYKERLIKKRNKMKLVAYNEKQLEIAIEDIKRSFEEHKRLNISYEKASKEKTYKQMGFIFAALIGQITDYFRSCGFNIDEEDVKYKLYEDVSEIVPEMVVDKQLFGGKPRIKHLPEMDRELCSKFINGIFYVLDSKPMYDGLKMHPSTFYNWVFHLDSEDVRIAQTANMPERDADYLNYVRTLPCICCGIQHRSEAHHIRDTRTAGIAIKSPDWYTVPLCHNCHMGVAHGTGFKAMMGWIPQNLGLYNFTRLCYLRWKNKK